MGWPRGREVEPFRIYIGFNRCACSETAATSTPPEFVRFFLAEGWLAHF